MDTNGTESGIIVIRLLPLPFAPLLIGIRRKSNRMEIGFPCDYLIRCCFRSIFLAFSITINTAVRFAFTCQR
jgi:hypothetical protein